MEGAAGHPVEVTAEWAWPWGGVDLDLRGWKNHPTSATMATAGMTITRNATMLSAMPKTRKASAASTAVITTTATAPMTQARHPVMTMVFPVNHDHGIISVFRVARFADPDRVSVIELDEHERLITAP
jgi:hypothetical protein